MVNQKFEKISLDEGLSQSVIYTILQDSTGFMWFGTQDGLNRYDGYKFKIFKNSKPDVKSIPNNYVMTLYEDSDGILWIGTLNGYLSKFDQQNDCFTSYDMNELIISRKTKLVTSVCEDDKGYLWIGTEGSGLNKFDKTRGEFIDIDPENNFESKMEMDIKCLLKDSDNHMWIGTKFDGIFELDLNENKLYNYKNNPAERQSLSDNFINNVFEDSRKNIFICTKKGMNIFSKSGKTFESYLSEPGNPGSISSNSAQCICEDQNNIFWVGTIADGLNMFDLEKKKFRRFKSEITEPNSLQNDSIFSIYCDRSNVLWIGTFGGGIHKLDCSAKSFFSVGKIQNSRDIELIKDVRAIFIDNSDNLWIGIFRKEIYKILRHEGSFKKYGRAENITGTIMCIYQDKDLNLWIGTWGGSLCLYNRDSDKFSFYKYSSESPDYIYSICGDADGNRLWIGTHNKGLLKFDIADRKFVEVTDNSEIAKQLSGLVLKNVIHKKGKNLFLCTAGKGLLNYDYGSDTLTEYDAGISSDDNVLSVFEDNKNLWIGCYYGLIKFKKDEKSYRKFTDKDGLPDNMIKAIYEDPNGNLWMSTNNGISKFNPDNESFRNYDVGDGLQSKEFNEGAYFKSNDGTFYFGGINGYTYFRPEDIKDNEYVPNIVITEFHIFNKSVIPSAENPYLKMNITEAEKINLSYRESVFSFEFVSLSYNNSQKNQYAYMMEGFDNDWVYCGSRRQATYTNLNPGNYTFKVKGSNNDNVWNEEGASIKINITPPYWKTLWFRSLGLMSIFAATAFTYQQRLDKIKKEKQRQEEFTKKLIQSQEDERKRIAGGLHDSLGQNLLILKNKALIGIKKTDDPKFKEQMSEISELASSTIDEVRVISYDLRPYELDRLGLTKTITSMVERANNSTNINFISDIENIDGTFTPEIEINIYRIMQECLSNVIKHSEATDVRVQLKKLEKEISITISDNGKGFNVEKKFSDTERKGFGLRGIPERVKLFGGELNIESKPGKGTRIKIILPILS